MGLGQILTNVYFYIGCVSSLLVVVQLVLLARRAHYSPTIYWLQIYIGLLFVVNIAQVGQFFGRSATAFDMAESLGTVAIMFYPVCVWYFVLNFLNMRKWVENFWSAAVIWSATVVFLVVSLRTLTIYGQDPALRVLRAWGYIVPHIAKYQLTFSAWSQALFLIALVLLIRSYRRSPDRARKRQTLLVIIGILLPEVVGTLTQAVLPIFGVDVLPGPLYVQALQAVCLTFALLRYGVVAIDPNAIASSIVQTMNSAALGLDRDGKIIFANAAATQLLGSSAKGLVGRPVKAMVVPEEWDKFKDGFLHTLETSDQNQMIESAVTDAKGNRLAVNAYGSTYRDKNGRLLATIVILADIQYLKELLADAKRLSEALATEKRSVESKVVERTRQLHEEQAKLRASIESLTLGFMLVDNNNHILVQNKALQKIFGLSDSVESVGQLTKLLADCDLAERCKAVRRKGRAVEVKEVGMDTKIFHLFIGPVKAGEEGKEVVIGTVVLVQDITEEKVLARSKDEFFSIASHELRTPLTAIKGNASMMLNYYGEILTKDPGLKEMVNDIHESSTRLIDIVGDFLDASRIEQGKMSFHLGSVSLDKIIESVFYEMGSVASKKRLSLQADTHTLGALPQVWVDKERVTQILYNLIGNAVKFTEAGGITVSTTVVGESIRLRVSDTGRGIPPKNQELLFRKFQQAGDSLITRDTTRGTGLGLYISRLMAEGMGGEIGLESSEVGKGSVFFFDIPIATKERLATDAVATTNASKEEIIDIKTGLAKG